MVTENLRTLISALVGEDADLSEITGELDGIDSVSEGAQARIAELEAQVAELTDKYTQTAARNYELMLSSTGEPAEGEGEGEDADAHAEEEQVIDSLFEED